MWRKRADMLVHDQDPYNAEPPPAVLGTAVLTPVDAFYSRNHGPVPDIARDDWRLRVDGMVRTPLELSLAELRSEHPAHTVVATLQCAGNRRAGLMRVRDIPGQAPWRDGATSTARWTGVRLGDVLRRAGIAEEARHVAFAASDVCSSPDEPAEPYGSSVPAQKALADEALLAWEMNGEPLPGVHGGPVRVLVPGYVGARSVKWVQQVTAQAVESASHFQSTAYRLLPADAHPPTAGPGFALGPVALSSAILEPEDGAVVAPGRLTVRGYALAGDHRSVARVDVSGDGGRTWQQATLEESLGPFAWRLWSSSVKVPSGAEVTILARAWDDTGAVQPERAASVWNPKGYVNHSWPRCAVTGSPG